ncbi:MAG: methylmalonyl-CoA epimerase, partial [Candidatus Marinimicrobia bacterium]|nr:methylmalonyl-CoA epimerase [Candidatus Neomarinimicrobiota bacterium]
MRILGIEHVAVATADLDEPARIFGQLLGLSKQRTEDIPDQQVITDIYATGSGKIEFVKPTAPESPVSKYLAKQGAGIHHIAFLVDDLRAWLRHLRQQGVELIDQEPRTGAEGFLIAFIHPSSTAGILV